MVYAWRAVVAVLAATSLTVDTSSAETVADFYRGKSVRMIIGHEAGGGYDIYARLVTSYMAKHLPGNPTIVAQNMPGAGSRIATNWVYNLAPRDGTVMGMSGQSMPVDQATNQPGVQFKAQEFGWIGNPAVDTMLMMAWAGSGLTSLDDVKTKGGLVCGGSGGTAPTVTYPRITKTLLGADIKVITGYSGSGNYLLAMERGELNCVAGTSWSLAKLSLAHHLQDYKINILMQIGPKKEPEISATAGREVPLILELAKTELDRKAMAVILSAVTVGRPFFAPPGTPEDRLAALRQAFNETMKDPEFLADAAAKKLNINPVTGPELQAVAIEVTSASPEVLHRVEELMGTSGPEEPAKAAKEK